MASSQELIETCTRPILDAMRPYELCEADLTPYGGGTAARLLTWCAHRTQSNAKAVAAAAAHVARVGRLEINRSIWAAAFALNVRVRASGS